jgi:endoglucanase
MFKKTLLLVFVCFLYKAHAQTIKLNQIGFYPDSRKIAIVPGAGTAFDVINSSNTTVYSGELSTAKIWSFSNESVKIADFTLFSTLGSYRIKVGSATSEEFKIADNVNESILKGTLKAFYYNRSSTELNASEAGIYARAAGHPDDVVYIHSSAASAARPTNSTISSPKGWYDAGDYNKYIVNSGISTFTLLSLYEHYPNYFNTLSLNIPESNNTLPDLLDEVLWNVDWMLTMQDPNDGGVYHKLTSKNFSSFIMPDADNSSRYVVMKTTAAALNFAAVMSVTSRVFANFETERPGFSAQCLNAAKAAWNWAKANPAITYRQPTDIATGTYGDGTLSDEFDWAGAELYITTLDESYLSYSNVMGSTPNTPSWANVAGLAWVSLGLHRDNLTAAASSVVINSKLKTLGDFLHAQYSSSAYKVAMGANNSDFQWGSNSFAANQSMMLLSVYNTLGDEKYLDAAISNVDYLLGRNPTGFSYVTGFGAKTPMHIHHRPSEADGIANPVPGFLAGGPQTGKEDGCSGYPSPAYPATCYLDDLCSYSTNEVTINWNAPLAFALGGLQALHSTKEYAPTISLDLVDVQVTEGASFTLAIGAEGTAPFSYEWKKDGQVIAGANDAVFSIARSESSDAGIYTVSITNTLGTVTSKSAQVTVSTKTAYKGIIPLIPGKVEAEEYDTNGMNISYYDRSLGNQGNASLRNDDVDIEITSDAGGGYNIGWIEDSEWLEYTVNVEKTGIYDFTFRAASENSTGEISITISNTEDIILSATAIVPTGDWQLWENTIVSGVSLTEGKQTWRLTIEKGDFNLNYFTVAAQVEDCDGTPGGLLQIDNCGRCLELSDPDFNSPCNVTANIFSKTSDIYAYPNPFSNELWIDLRNIESVASMQIINLEGKIIFEQNNVGARKMKIETLDGNGIYFVKVILPNAVEVLQVLKK